MNSTRRVPPWAIAGLATAFVVGSIIWDAVGTPDPPDMRDRGVVMQRLSQVDGIRPVLPVTLPPGYEYARDYDYEADDAESMSLDETTDRSASWSVFFFPEDGASKDGLPVVVFCVQNPDSKDVLCPEHADATHLLRRFGATSVAIYRASPGRRDMAAWRSVDLTTDLEKVTWLR